MVSEHIDSLQPITWHEPRDSYDVVIVGGGGHGLATAYYLAARHGITIVNAPGLIDSGYRGELQVVLLNTDARETFTVEPGMRIAQLVVMPVPAMRPVEVQELPRSERGVRGFGSS